ncbi:hypothetical protein AGABI2DRAFT_69910 [Agaricus bisporus var. bisporus H97]|uniref:hypothetical protein n=1 Tax=Agaricus bisporus var. bisporus (strain H97 / ATCC MYA-4626 / FGSC 10389) TaxID=936046 RepID=UPI00029F6D6B|nr:hypothetical protein AGABI2DRAFT_69910 [Agaricus bisporus var. bisporus H97]EKV47345.1 hypothetical protein AGABI2DRAFT_69910 [Agaricus bisporus var. bisporus H97]
MLEAAIAYRSVYDALTTHKDNGLRMYELSDEEWALAEQICEVLQVQATKFFSRKNESLLSSVIPTMDDIDETLEMSIKNEKYSPALVHALTLGKRTLNKYYSQTDASELYHIALILDPHYKVAYMRDAHWPSMWVDTAEDLVRDTFEMYYAPEQDPINEVRKTLLFN